MPEIALIFEVEECRQTQRVVRKESTMFWVMADGQEIVITKWNSSQTSVRVESKGLSGHRRFGQLFSIQNDEPTNELFRVLDAGEREIRVEKLTQKAEAGSSG